MVEKTHPVRLLGLHHPPGEQELLGGGPAHLVGQGPGAVDATVGDGEEAEPGVLATYAHIEARGKHRAAAVGQPVHHANDRLGRCRDVVHPVLVLQGIGLSLLLSQLLGVHSLLVDVASRREGPLPRAGDDDAAHALILVSRHYGVVQFAVELVVHCVQDFGAVHRDEFYAVFDFHQQVLVFHQ